jgi:hypothetical protein
MIARREEIYALTESKVEADKKKREVSLSLFESLIAQEKTLLRRSLMLRIMELVEKLSPNLQEEVVDFIEFLMRKKAKTEKEKSEEAIDIMKLKGVFHSYADASKVELEKEAWKSYVVKRWREA